MLEEAQQQVQARLVQAEQAANNQMDEADRYALEMLRRLDAQLGAFSTTIRTGIDALEERFASGRIGGIIYSNPNNRRISSESERARRYSISFFSAK